jgi:hypothetical protein
MFSTEISSSLAHEHVLELRRAVRASRGGRRRARARADAAELADVMIRVARPADREALAQLAQLDSRPAPDGYVLVAEVAGELRAAVAVAGGQPIADPFHPTAALTSLLALRARQLQEGEAVPARRSSRRSLVFVTNR